MEYKKIGVQKRYTIFFVLWIEIGKKIIVVNKIVCI